MLIDLILQLHIFQTRMQSLAPEPNANYRNVADAFYRIVRHEGLGRTLRGIDAMILGAGPAHAMYFACYEQLKFMLSRSGKGNHIAHGELAISLNFVFNFSPINRLKCLACM